MKPENYGKRWSKGETDFVLKNKNVLTDRVIARYLKRTISAIRKVRFINGEPKIKKWCYDHIDFDNSLFGYVVGAVLGDGNIIINGSHHRVVLDVRDKEFADYHAKVLEELIGHKPTQYDYYRGEKDYYFVGTFTKVIYDEVKKVKENLQSILRWDIKKQIMFLKGFCDAEACFGKRQIVICNSNCELLNICELILQKIGIKGSKIYVNAREGMHGHWGRTTYGLTVSRKENRKLLYEIIGCRIQRKLKHKSSCMKK